MEFQFVPLTMELVREIDSWNYSGFVEEVAMDAYFDSFSETKTLTGPGGCHGFAVLVENDTVGLFEFTKKGRALEIGLALRPELIGKGLGTDYVRQGIEFGIHQYGLDLEFIRLVVDSKNTAAIRVYEKIGFQRTDKSDDGIEMVLPLTSQSMV